MRSMMISLFLAIPVGTNKLKDDIMRNKSTAWALQNDADEIANGKVLSTNSNIFLLK